MKPNRNESCPCGSGRKYKKCCELKDQTASSRGPILLIGTVLALLAVVVVATLRREPQPVKPQAEVAAPAPVTPATSLPAVTTPVTTQVNPIATASAPGAIAPSSPLNPPPGKVWSAEHKHWHNATGVTVGTPVTGGAAPIGVTANASPITNPQETGRVWSQEHKHWHKAPGTVELATPAPNSQASPIKIEVGDGLKQPPPGKVWSAEHQHWHNKDGAE